MHFTKKEATKLYKRMKNDLLFHGFDQLTIEQKETIEKKNKFKEPKIARIKETKNQTVFQKEIDWYKIVVLASYDEEKKNFTKAGRIWVHVTAPRKNVGEKRLFTTSFFRRGNFPERLYVIIKFLLHALEHRPLDLKNKPMELVEKPIGTFNWVSVDNKREKISFFKNIPRLHEKEILKYIYQKDYYEKVVRPRLGIVNRKRKQRKKRVVRTPQNVVPYI